MFSRRYLQSSSVAFLLVVTCLSVLVEGDANFFAELSQHGTNATDLHSEGSPTDPLSYGIYNGTQITATPALSTDLPSFGEPVEAPETSTAAITPSAASLPTMIITATKVTLGHRMLPVEDLKPTASSGELTGDGEGVTETPVEEATTYAPVTGPSSEKLNTQEETPGSAQNTRQSRFQRLPEGGDSSGMDASVTESPLSGNDIQETSTDYYRELEGEGGDNYIDYGEHNDLGGENLPTPMALINTNGEGNNPPLEDDFAEAFKKVNSNNRRRRFRGGRRGRMRIKKFNTTTFPTGSSQDLQSSGSKYSESEGTFYGTDEQTTQPPNSPSNKPKRYRSTTTPNSLGVGPTAPSGSSSTSTESASEGSNGNVPIVKNGPKPIILQNFNQGNTDPNNITPTPQIEKPGGGAHTEKISTYFFSTPSPSTRIRMRQRAKDSVSTTTSTESPTEIVDTFPTSISNTFPTDTDAWKDSFDDFPKHSFLKNPAVHLKIPEFVPMDLGLETDKQDPIETALSQPDPPPLESKAYSIHHSPDSISHTAYESYKTRSTTPKTSKTRRPPTSSTFTKIGYDTQVHVSPTLEADKPTGPADYYNTQGSDSQSSSTYATSLRQPGGGGGSHYDRTKDQVIFYDENQYNSPHPTSSLADSPTTNSSPGSSRTVGSHLSVADGLSSYGGQMSTTVVDHYHPAEQQNEVGLYTPGQVYPAEIGSHMSNPFKNGPPDSSHIHSPNMIESSSTDSGHRGHHHHSAHHPLGRPGDGVYGTVEEVPVYGNHYEQPPHHGSHHASSASPYPFGGSGGGRSPHGLTYPTGSGHAPPPPPPTHPSHHQGSVDFTPSFQILPEHDPRHNSHDSSPLNHNAEVSNEGNTHNNPASQVQGEAVNHDVGLQPDPSPTPSEPSDLLQGPGPSAPPPTAGSPTIYGGPQPDSFPSHHHTMATHPDYEPANPPLPHDHPFHKSFLPFPTQEMHGGGGGIGVSGPGHDQFHDTNSISNSPYHPGNVQHSPGGKPGYEPVIHGKPLSPSRLEFAPIPTDVKTNDLYNHFNSKPYESPPGPPPPSSPTIIHHGQPGYPQAGQQEYPQAGQQEYTQAGQPDYPQAAPPEYAQAAPPDYPQGLPPAHQMDHHQVNHHHHMNDHHGASYMGPSGAGHYGSPPEKDINVLSYSTSDIDPNKDMGYAGPVAEIHPGVYSHPSNGGEQSLGDNGFSNNGNNYHIQDEKSPYGESGPTGHEQPGDLEQAYKQPQDNGNDKPSENQLDQGDHLNQGPQETDNGNNAVGQSSTPNKKAVRRPFSKTPYVLMFPQLIPEAQMRPSPPSMLSKEIPVIQASSMASLPDFTSEGEKPPLGPGFQAVPVHPRHQMYQVLAKTHYDKMMEKYMESKRRPPSAIYTPYGILIPVGTNVADASSSTHHNVFAPKPRLPPKFRGEKSLLNVLLGSPSSTNGRFHAPNNIDGKGSRLNKVMEYEPAIDLLAEKLAMKIIAAQQALNGNSKLGSMGSYSEQKPFVVEKSLLTRDGKSKNPHSWLGDQDQLTMESKSGPGYAAGPELKQYLKTILKGHFTEMMETSPAPIDENRRPSTLSAKLLNSFFRKGRLNVPPKTMIPMPSASMTMTNKVPAPQGLPNPIHHSHSGIGHPLSPLAYGPGGLLGSIKRLFSFGPPERHDAGISPNFAGRTLYVQNGSRPYLDGPSPRSSHYAKMVQSYTQQPGGMVKQYPLPPVQSKHTQSNYGTLPTKSPKKKRKSSTKKPGVGDDTHWQNNRPTSSPPTPTTTTRIISRLPIKGSSSSSTNGTTTAIKKTGIVSSNSVSSKVKGDTSDISSKKSVSSLLNKRTGSTSSQQEQSPPKSKPSKLDMFQTLLGSTRSVLNYFKSEGRKSGPTVLKPRSLTIR